MNDGPGELVRVSSWGDWEVVHCSSKYNEDSSKVKVVDPRTGRRKTEDPMVI
ncbi:hypothetical protein CHS0354_001125 [Potamilus streckersoni]|uniref:Uncharacterized protein n=1 Tax=Potamilus streckersoni TaxID=2493646 RepID=A0AAE0SYV2_9BIVA|nr:hypothetical protein CHS0354_001125 [Potamilus streckersoni]